MPQFFLYHHLQLFNDFGMGKCISSIFIHLPFFWQSIIGSATANFLFLNEASKNSQQRKRRKENWPFLCETHVGFVKCSGNNYYFGCCFSRFTATNLCFCYLEMRFSLSLTTMFMLQFVKQTTFSESTCRTLKIIKETSILIKHIKELYDHLLKQYTISKLYKSNF